MSDTIQVLVNRAAPFWLPRAAEVDEETNVRRTIAPARLLRPGTNTISRRRWELAASHPTVRVHCETGTLVLDASSETLRKHSHAPDSLSGLSGLSIAKSKPWIDACGSLETLAKWRTIETKGKGRSGILELLDARSEALDEAALG